MDCLIIWLTLLFSCYWYLSRSSWSRCSLHYQRRVRRDLRFYHHRRKHLCRYYWWQRILQRKFNNKLFYYMRTASFINLFGCPRDETGWLWWPIDLRQQWSAQPGRHCQLRFISRMRSWSASWIFSRILLRWVDLFRYWLDHLNNLIHILYSFFVNFVCWLKILSPWWIPSPKYNRHNCR